MAARTRHIPVTTWAVRTYGEYAPTPYALRVWIMRGKIQPPPERLLGRWVVLPGAEYREG